MAAGTEGEEAKDAFLLVRWPTYVVLDAQGRFVNPIAPSPGSGLAEVLDTILNPGEQIAP